LVLPRIADVVSATLESRAPLDVLVEYFSQRPALLVLDNLEQVVAVAPEIDQLLARCRGLQILATSRTVLRLRAEREYPVAPLAVPVFAERRHQTPWHPHHITERYGLFTLIVLGESLLASANAIVGALEEVESLGPLIAIAVLTLVVTAALWWIYFWPPHHRAITSFGRSLRYGYTHYFVFAAAAAFSAGIEVEIDLLTHHSELSSTAASFTVTVPIAVFLLGVWWIAIRENADRIVNVVVPAGALLVLLDPVLPIPVALTAVILIGIVTVLVIRRPVTRSDSELIDGA
jgi:low temperature requirement protein LtrA